MAGRNTRIVHWSHRMADAMLHGVRFRPWFRVAAGCLGRRRTGWVATGDTRRPRRPSGWRARRSLQRARSQAHPTHQTVRASSNIPKRANRIDLDLLERARRAFRSTGNEVATMPSMNHARRAERKEHFAFALAAQNRGGMIFIPRRRRPFRQ